MQAAKDGGIGAGAEEAAAAGGAALARAGATALTGGASDVAGTVAPGVNKVIDKIGQSAGRLALRGTKAVASVSLILVLALVAGLTGGFSAVISAVSGGGPTAPAPTDDQCNSMPAGWCDVLYAAEQKVAKSDLPTPWTVLAGLARVATDYGRTSPYDAIDRTPDRPVPSYLAAHFSASDTTGGGSLGTVPYNADSLAWGGYENGKIPAAALCATLSGKQLECQAATALEQLNNAYISDHHGTPLALEDAYRDLAGQEAALAAWTAKGSPGNAAKVGQSNHGWAKAVDFANFGGVNDYSSPNYVWMQVNGPKFGWVHPSYMDEGGKGPHEPWHWEYRGGTGQGTTTPASYTTSATSHGLTVGVSAAGTVTGNCDVANPTTPIGGTGRQAAGPFLLLPAAAKALQDDGGNPQSACDAADYVAQILSQTAKDVIADQGAPQGGDEAAAATFWQTVINRAHIIADPTVSSGDCLIPGGDGQPVNDLIDSIWRCEASQYAQLHVVAAATTDSTGKVVFTETDTSTGLDMLVAEAKQVAWSSSQDGARPCTESAATAGVFPLTAASASSVQTVERCNTQQNIRAAARLVLAGEAVAVADRPATSGPFSPMLGGWAAIPAALGSDLATFATTGPPSAWRASAACTSAVDQVVTSHAQAGSPFTGLAGAANPPSDTHTYSAFLGNWPQAVIDACPGATSAQLADTGATMAQAHLADNPGIVPARTGDTAAAPSTEPATDAAPAGDGPVPSGPGTTGAAPTPAASASGSLTLTPLGGRGSSVAHAVAAASVDPQALQGLSNWFSWQAQAGNPGTAVFGTDSVVARLSTTGKVPAASTSAPSSSAFTPAAWQTQVTDWATFYGGNGDPFDTFGTRSGTLASSLSGVGGQYAAVSGDAASQANTVIEAAKRYLGTPYSWGGGGPNGPSAGTGGLVGFDCSGLTEYAFAQAGYQIGGYTGTQQTMGTPVASLADAQPGDLLFFGSPIHHVAIYLGNNQMVHAPKPGDVVKVAAVYEAPSLIRRVIVARAPSGSLDTWISSALTVLYQNGFPKGQDDTAALNLIISRESSGNPQAVNKTDSNWVAGHPSFGLMQTIPSTFEAYALPSYTDKADPVAQIIAGARYAQARYGGLDNVPGVKSVRAGGAYVGY